MVKCAGAICCFRAERDHCFLSSSFVLSAAVAASSMCGFLAGSLPSDSAEPFSASSDFFRFLIRLVEMVETLEVEASEKDI